MDQDKDNNMVKECGVCQDEYNDNEKCPRMLPCAHTFCSQCILELINRHDKKCPNCRETFNGTSERHFKVNIAFLDLLQYIKNSEKKNSSSVKPSEVRVSSRSRMLKELKSESEEINNENIESCRKTEKQIHESLQRNNDMKRSVLATHKMAKEEITSNLQTLKEACEKKITFLDMENVILEGKLKEVKAKIQHLEDIKNNLDRAKTLNSVDEIALEVEEKGTVIQTWIKEFNSYKSYEEKIFKEFQKNVRVMEEKVIIIKEILDSTEMEEKSFTHHMEDLTLKDNLGRIPQMNLKSQNPWMKEVLRSGRLYSVHEVANKRIFGKISLEGDNLMVHCLRDQQLLSNSYTIEHSDVMSLVNPSSKRAFLEFGTDQSILGIILIDLTPQSKRAENFFVLCNGRMGPSYLNTNVLHVWDKGEAGENIWCGDRKYNYRIGRMEVVKGAGEEEGGAFQRPWIAGSVCRYGPGDSNSEKFIIITKDDPSRSSPAVFGSVVSGLNVITDAISHFPKIEIVQITNCGIVLPL